MGDWKWNRTFAISVLVFALLLVIGSIFLHVQQRHHLGRLNYMDKPPQPSDVDADEEAGEHTLLDQHVNISSTLSVDQWSAYEYDYDTNSGREASAGPDDACLECICITAGSCSSVANKYRISYLYWMDGGERTPDQNTGDMVSDYSRCMADDDCSERTIEAYMSRFATDCNGDGLIDCRDFLAIHISGPKGCVNSELPAPYATRMETCIDDAIA